MMHKEGSPNILSAGTIIGNKVVNPKGENIGKINEIMLDLDHGTISYAVLQFGGVMGMGDKLFAIPWQALEIDGDKKRFILRVDKKVLDKAEGFDQDNWPDAADYKWLAETYGYYGYDPYWL
jgi:sporulation protein YlmC with PRC-barrel domain